jgi:serine protease Do
MANLLGFNRGDQTEVLVLRDGQPQRLAVTLEFDPTAALGTPAGPATMPAALAFGITPELTDNTQGRVVVRSVRDNTPAARAGLKAGDLITAVAGKPVESIAAYTQLMNGFNRGDKLEVSIVRDGKAQQLPVVLDFDPNTPLRGGGRRGGPGR